MHNLRTLLEYVKVNNLSFVNKKDRRYCLYDVLLLCPVISYTFKSIWILYYVVNLQKFG